MFALKWLLMAASFAIFGTAAGVVGYDVYLALQFQKLMSPGEPGAAEKAGTRRPIRWQLAGKLFGCLVCTPTAKSVSSSNLQTALNIESFSLPVPAIPLFRFNPRSWRHDTAHGPSSYAWISLGAPAVYVALTYSCMVL